MTSLGSKALKTVLGWAAGLSGAYARDFRSKTVVVAFHRVDNDLPADGLTVNPAKFETFCRFFLKHFRVVSFAEQVAGAHAGKDMGGTLSITFDDGYLDNYTVAAPILRRLGLPATFFVTTSFVGSTGFVAPWDKKLSNPPGWMSWDQVRALRRWGFDIGCHTDTHINLATSDAAAIRADLSTARAKLFEQLGEQADLFVYPFGGRHNITPDALALVREAGFVCCASCYGGTNPAVADPYALRRIGVAEWFESANQFGFELYTNRTAVAPKRRYANATSSEAAT
jgi:peptidoglycan/xylan/chitin deacetylase (PgdA/CDA1 family)